MRDLEDVEDTWIWFDRGVRVEVRPQVLYDALIDQAFSFGRLAKELPPAAGASTPRRVWSLIKYELYMRSALSRGLAGHLEVAGREWLRYKKQNRVLIERGATVCRFVCTMRLCRAAMHKGVLGIHTISFCVLAETHITS